MATTACNCDETTGTGDAGTDATGDVAIVACATGSWDADADPATACVAWSSCAPGTFVSADGTATSDRVCGDCATGTFTTANNASSCTAFTDCAPGTYVTAEGTSTADRTCMACAGGTFSTTSNAVTCETWSNCLAGTYVSTTPSDTQDRACMACDPGFYTSQPNSSSCAAVGTCAAGTVETTPATETMPPVCTTCGVGTYCAGGTAAPIPCMNEQWDDDASAASLCVDWADCAVGSEIDEPGSATANRTCELCTGETFSDESNAEACEDWRDCEAGQHVTFVGSHTLNRTCAGCDSGEFSTEQNAESCTEWTDCPAGRYVFPLGSDTADQGCEPCATDTYTSLPNSTMCMPIGACAPGTVQTAAGSDMMPVACTACDAGTYCAGGTTPAEPCATGMWDHDNLASSACQPKRTCIEGTFVADEGSTILDRTCTACDTGEYSDTPNATECEPLRVCLPGTRVDFIGSASANRTCQPCTTGRFSDGFNAMTCELWTECERGEFIDEDGALDADQVCAECATGEFSATINAEACTPIGTCAAGSIQTAPGSNMANVTCEACSAGNYCAGGTDPAVPCSGTNWDHDGNAANVCQPWNDCPAGTSSVDGSATTGRTCTACVGSFNTAPNSPTCTTWTDCGTDRYQSVAPSEINDRSCANYVSCNDWHVRSPSSPNGTYVIDPDGAGAGGTISVQCEMVIDGGGWTIIGFDDFTSGAPGWSDASRDTSSSCVGVYGVMLGGVNTFGAGAASEKTYDFLGIAHTEVFVDLDYYVIDSWDTERALVYVDGTTIYDVAFPYNGGASNVCGSGTWNDYGRRDVFATQPHITNTMLLRATSTLDQGANDESWGIDNVSVWIR